MSVGRPMTYVLRVFRVALSLRGASELRALVRAVRLDLRDARRRGRP